MNATGRVIYFEGIDGSGKSSALDAVYGTLAEKGIPVIKTAEPGGTQLGTKIKELLHSGDFGRTAEFFLFQSAKAVHMDEVIAPAIQNGTIVLCDRGPLSTDAYQVAGNNMSKLLVDMCGRTIGHDKVPAVTLVFSLPVETAIKRSVARDNNPSYYERDTEKMIRIASYYEKVALSGVYMGGPCIRIDALRPLEDVARTAEEAVMTAICRTSRFPREFAGSSR